MAILEVQKNAQPGVAVLWLDEPGEKFNKLTLDMAPQFTSILDELERDPDVKALVIASKKKDSFIAGADVNQFLTIQTANEGETLSRQGNQMFDRLAQFKKPKVAAIHGVCMGGGTEMALACDARIASDWPKTFIALPEVKLGLLPGAGGSQRLPRLVGMQNALEMMLTGKNIYAKKAYKMGLVDATIHPAALLDAACKLALELVQAPIQRKKKMPWIARLLESNGIGRWLIARGARKMVQKQSGGHYPAPFKIIECVQIGLSNLEQGRAAECKKFGELSAHPVTRELVRLFFNMNAHKKNPNPDLVKKLEKIGILGAGFMGSGIAQVTAPKDLEVFLKDIKQETLEQAEKIIWDDLQDQIKKSSITPVERDIIMSRVFTQTNYHAFDKIGLVIEAVFEDLGLKQRVLAEVENVIQPECVFASNTSCIPITEIAQNAKNPERILGMHYFSPVAAMPLLEIIVTKKTADWALSTAYELGMKQGKTMIVVQDGPGFYTTRVLMPMMMEALTLLEEGGEIRSIDQAMKKFGFPVGPVTLLDEVGIDVAAHISKIMADFFKSRGIILSPMIAKVFGEGYWGRKNKKGFYTYGDKKKKEVNTSIYAFFGGPKRRNIPTIEIQNRLSLVMMNEAALCLQEGILENPEDGDIGAILGIGFPPFLGGPFRYIDALGSAKVVAMMQELEHKYGSKFIPAPILVEMAKQNSHFYKD